MIYQPLELGQPGNPKCPDKFTEESTLVCPRSERVVLQLSSQAVVVQFGIMPQGRGTSAASVVWQALEPYLPLIGAFSRSFDAVRVRNYTPGAEAQVLINVVGG